MVHRHGDDQALRVIIDVAGFRQRRAAALETFARRRAEEVLATGVAEALEPMSAADRKIVHDTVATTRGTRDRARRDSSRSASSSSGRWSPAPRLPTTDADATTGGEPAADEGLVGVLAEAQLPAGAIGGGPIESHIAHALGFAVAWPTLGDSEWVLDLGSGGGLPGLVLAVHFPATRFVLLDGRAERARLLGEAGDPPRLGLPSRGGRRTG